MSGHSKWAQIKRSKGAADKKKGQAFSKFAREIAIAAAGGGDPATNFKLRLVLDRAKDADMTRDAIERAVKRGTGEDKNATAIEDVVYEGYGPGGTAFLVQAATDSRNRSTQNIRHIFSKHGGNLGGQGSAMFIFNADRKPKVILEFDEPTKQLIRELMSELENDEDVIAVHTNANL